MSNCIFVLLLAFSPFSARAAAPDLSFICSHFMQREPRIDADLGKFSPEFLRAAPKEKLKAAFRDVVAIAGPCRSFAILEEGAGELTLVLNGDDGVHARFKTDFDLKTGLIVGLLASRIDDPRKFAAWSDVERALAALGGGARVSATLRTADGAVDLSSHGDDAFAVGSTFKLYVLGALLRAIASGERAWTDVMPLREDWKSLPSGEMQDWVAGAPVTLYQYAEKMISISDNTATDHLIRALGRGNVEAMLIPMGNASELSHFPFLTTLEMFKLKWAIDPSRTAAYVAANASDRRVLLEGLESTPRSAVGTNGVSMETPYAIDKLEWFASTRENCRAMFWLANQESAEARAILSKNVPILEELGFDRGRWRYAGFKGGSEPGVLNLTYLLETTRGSRACFAMSWNDDRAPASIFQAMHFMRKALAFAATAIP